jgi:FAD/FMN-containing dehydrogenase
MSDRGESAGGGWSFVTRRRPPLFRGRLRHSADRQVAPGNILETQSDLRFSNVEAPLVGHAGDGNFHRIIMLDPDDEKELATVTGISERLVERALKFGGTCSGEHGIGIGKLQYLAAGHGDALDVMRSIKRAIDPDNLMNPGKLIPEPSWQDGSPGVHSFDLPETDDSGAQCDRPGVSGGHSR